MNEKTDDGSGRVVPITSLGVSRTYREALDLAVRAKWLLIRQRAAAAGRHATGVRSAEEFGDRVAAQTTYAAETMRVSSRIMHVVAWTMNRKAVEAGEIDEAEARTPERRLGGRSVCLGEPVGEIALLPAPIRELWEESERLYRRALRLEGMIERTRTLGVGPAADSGPPNPLTELASRLGIAAGNDDAPASGPEAPSGRGSGDEDRTR